MLSVSRGRASFVSVSRGGRSNVENRGSESRACPMHPMHRCTHARIPSRIPLPRLRFSLSFYWPSSRSSPLSHARDSAQVCLMCSTCLRNNHLHRWTFVSCASEDRAKISGTKDEKLKCFGFYEDPPEERLKFVLFLFDSRFFGLGIKKKRVLCEWSGKLEGDFFMKYTDISFLNSKSKKFVNFYELAI